MQWKENQAEGRKLLDAISTDARELHAILGPDYTMVATQLGINAVASIPGQAMPSGQPNAVAGPSKSSRTTTTATTKKKRPKETTGVSPSRPPPKRQKQDRVGEPPDIIDLT